VWVKDEGSFVNVKAVLHDTTMLGISIYQFDERYHLRSITAAERATFQNGQSWELSGVKQTKFNEAGAQVSQLDAMEWHSSLSPSLFTVLLIEPEQMSASSLYQYIQHLDDNKQKTSRYKIAMWNKVAYPFAVLVMMLLALPFSSYNKREGGVSSKIFLGVVLGLGFHFSSRLFANLGTLKDWWPMFSATAMTWMFLGLALLMLWRTERR
jgi:lipopolysaccharide export system permease protein